MMTKDKLAELQQQGLKAVGAARAIYDAAEAAGRQMSPSEQADYDREMAAAQDWLKQIRTARDDLAVIEKAQEISDAIGGMPGSPLGPTPAGSKDRRLTFAGMGAAAAMKIPDSAPNVKALATGGTVVTGQTFTADPVALGRPATSILDVLPVTTQASDQFAYLRQSVRTNNAAITPEGQVKPTSIYTVTRIEDRLDVVAHLSEAIPRFWIVDNVALEQFLSLELEYGLSLAVQAMVVSDVTSGSSFDIDVTRDGGWWMVHIPELGGLTQARFPREVEPMAREYIAVSTGTPIDQVAINRHCCTL